MKWKGFRPAYMIRQELHLTMWQRIKRVFLYALFFLHFCGQLFLTLRCERSIMTVQTLMKGQREAER